MDFALLDRLLQLNLGISQRDNEEAFTLLDTVYPLEIKRFPSGMEHNGWVIPADWAVHRALIRREGEVLFDGTEHPLAVAQHSSSFAGTVSKKELDEHVFYSREFPDAYGFHARYNLRPWQEHWGLCVPYSTYREWGEGSYEVDLEAEFVPGEMLVGECVHKGQIADTIVFNAHTCHPCQANDDMVGVLTVLELFKWLATQETRYTYLGVLAPEHVGTVFYIADLPEERLSSLKLGCFVEMMGSDTPFALQRSFFGDTIIDRVAEYVLRDIEPQLNIGEFGALVGNDESVWEAPGVEVPMISVSRWPFQEYHTSLDNPDIISRQRVEESLEALKRIVRVLEEDRTIERKFNGLVALSNPRYNLYKEHPDPMVEKGLTEVDLRFARMQDPLPRHFNGEYTVFEIAEKFGVPFEDLREYIGQFKEKGLVDLHALPGLDAYRRGHSRAR